MTSELVVIIVGAVMGTVSTLCVTLLLKKIEDSRREKSVRDFSGLAPIPLFPSFTGKVAQTCT